MIIRLLISLFALGLAMALLLGENTDNQKFATGLIGFVVAYWLK
jgi:hypothetical protein